MRSLTADDCAFSPHRIRLQRSYALAEGRHLAAQTRILVLEPRCAQAEVGLHLDHVGGRGRVQLPRALESFELVADSDELLASATPLGAFFRERTAGLPSFVDGDVFVPPVVAPPRGAGPGGRGGPRRHFFLFGAPRSTAGIDAADADACAALYDDVQRAVRDGVDYLKRARRDDPFDDEFARRALYEAVTRTAAPSFVPRPFAAADAKGRRLRGNDT